VSNNWPFDPIMSTVVLSNGPELLSREGYEFGGYLFHPEEMGNLGQFAGTRLKQYGNLLLGVTNGNNASSPKGSYNSTIRPPHEPKVGRNTPTAAPSNRAASNPIRIKPRGTSSP